MNPGDAMRLAVARREGPSDAAETCLRHAFEASLARVGDPDDLAHTFSAWFEYLVTFGRFAEAGAARERAMPALGASFFAKPRAHVRGVVEAVAAMASPDIFYRALQPGFLAPDLVVTRFEGPLPRGVPGVLEAICVATPVPLFTGEPLWTAFARVVGTQHVSVFTLDWFGEEWLARPAAWATKAYLGAREYGPNVAPGAAPRPSLGPASPYFAPFMHFIGVQLMNAAPTTPGVHVPESFSPSLLRAPVPSLAPRSWPPPPGARPRSSAGRIALVVVTALLLAAGAACGSWQLRRYLRAAHH